MAAGKNGFSQEEVLAHPSVVEALQRGIIELKPPKILYNLGNKRSENWDDPEEWVRCLSVARWVIEKDYPPARIKTEVVVPRRTPNDLADIVVYRDDRCREPYAVEECKSAGQSKKAQAQAIEQAFGNANSLDAPYVLYNEGIASVLFERKGHASLERETNRRGEWDHIPKSYGDVSEYAYFAAQDNDIKPAKAQALENRIKRAHSMIWAGGKRDPLNAFDEWSKLLFAKVVDERYTKKGQPRRFQVGSKETTAAVANRIHDLFRDACSRDPAVFPESVRITLPDRKVFDVVKVLQDVSFVRTDVDSIGIAFENFFGSVFRGELGQYFTMRPLARFTVAMLDMGADTTVLDPTAGSGGFLLEALLQVWHRIEREYDSADAERLKNDFALQNVFGIEIHDILARICKINLMLHHDGHTNIEGDRSCLDSEFDNKYLKKKGTFARIIGNPPFGDEVADGDDDHLGQNHLGAFQVATGRDKVASEHVIVERAVQFLESGGRMGLVLPDGVLNNQGEISNCPTVRRFLAKQGIFEAIVSLPDYAFRKSGAQNKTSILFFQKFTDAQAVRFQRAYSAAIRSTDDEDAAIAAGIEVLDYKVFLAEANHVGYTTTGAPSPKNDLYIGSAGGHVEKQQAGTILGEYRAFRKSPTKYAGRQSPDCMTVSGLEMWQAHASHRLDPKYFLFKREEQAITPAGWVRVPLRKVMKRREDIAAPEGRPDEPVKVMTISQAGDIRPREAGKGRNPPEWLGMYFEESPSTWFAARAGDVVFSSIDLWKGCIAVVPPEFDGAIVTKEFPIYQVIDDRLDPDFLSAALRSRFYQRAFRAITTGHSNRRRTQLPDFEALDIIFPEDRDRQQSLIAGLVEARASRHKAMLQMSDALLYLSDTIDGRGTEELPEVEGEESDYEAE